MNMIRSDALDGLNAALSAAQGEFESVAKTATNPFFKSKYAALPEVVNAATPILAKHGLAVWQGSDTDEQGELLWTVVLHSSGQYIGSAARMLPIEDKNGVVNAQAQGSALTYQRRYQYMAALGLVADEDDDGNRAVQSRAKPISQQQPVKLVTPQQAAQLQALSDELVLSPTDLADAILGATGNPIRDFKSLDEAYAWCTRALAKLPAKLAPVVEEKLRKMANQKVPA